MPLDLEQQRVGSILNLLLPGRVDEVSARRNAVVVAAPTKDRPDLVSLCPIVRIGASDVDRSLPLELVVSLDGERAFINCAAVYQVALSDREATFVGHLSDEVVEKVGQNLAWRTAI
ncbi:MAG TPA: type II toxin-antitoxin system PemK/MazF family toxin [Burkholderiaceae bacterium]|nr:type II toxin-antitoxin system PemK/MazF family toxin [Burkholderiaceae bacterium]